MDKKMDGQSPCETGKTGRSAREIADWLVVRLARLLNCPPADIDLQAPCDRLGLDSATVVGLTLELEDFLDVTIEPAIFYDYPTLQRLADDLARRLNDRA